MYSSPCIPDAWDRELEIRCFTAYISIQCVYACVRGSDHTIKDNTWYILRIWSHAVPLLHTSEQQGIVVCVCIVVRCMHTSENRFCV